MNSSIHREAIKTILLSKAKSENVSVDESYISTFMELFQAYIELLGHDLEHYAKHAKRQTINIDDIRLSLKRNPSLLRKFSETADRLE